MQNPPTGTVPGTILCVLGSLNRLAENVQNWKRWERTAVDVNESYLAVVNSMDACTEAFVAGGVGIWELRDLFGELEKALQDLLVVEDPSCRESDRLLNSFAYLVIHFVSFMKRTETKYHQKTLRILLENKLQYSEE